MFSSGYFKIPDIEHLSAIYYLSIILVFNLYLVGLFVKRARSKRNPNIYLLLIALTSAAIASLFYIIEDFTVDILSTVLKALYVVLFIIVPFLLMIFAENIYGKGNHRTVYVLGGGLIVILIVDLLTTGKIVYYIEGAWVMACFVFMLYYFGIRSPLMLKKIPKKTPQDIYIRNLIISIGVGIYFFFGFFIMIYMYDVFKLLPLKFGAFTSWFLFLISIYLGFYNPEWLRKKLLLKYNIDMETVKETGA